MEGVKSGRVVDRVVPMRRRLTWSWTERIVCRERANLGLRSKMRACRESLGLERHFGVEIEDWGLRENEGDNEN